MPAEIGSRRLGGQRACPLVQFIQDASKCGALRINFADPFGKAPASRGSRLLKNENQILTKRAG